MKTLYVTAEMPQGVFTEDQRTTLLFAAEVLRSAADQCAAGPYEALVEQIGIALNGLNHSFGVRTSVGSPPRADA